MIDRMHQMEKRKCVHCKEIFVAESILQKVCNKCYFKNRGNKRRRNDKN